MPFGIPSFFNRPATAPQPPNTTAPASSNASPRPVPDPQPTNAKVDGRHVLDLLCECHQNSGGADIDARLMKIVESLIQAVLKQGGDLKETDLREFIVDRIRAGNPNPAAGTTPSPGAAPSPGAVPSPGAAPSPGAVPSPGAGLSRTAAAAVGVAATAVAGGLAAARYGAVGSGATAAVAGTATRAASSFAAAGPAIFGAAALPNLAAAFCVVAAATLAYKLYQAGYKPSNDGAAEQMKNATQQAASKDDFAANLNDLKKEFVKEKRAQEIKKKVDEAVDAVNALNTPDEIKAAMTQLSESVSTQQAIMQTHRKVAVGNLRRADLMMKDERKKEQIKSSLDGWHKAPAEKLNAKQLQEKYGKNWLEKAKLRSIFDGQVLKPLDKLVDKTLPEIDLTATVNGASLNVLKEKFEKLKVTAEATLEALPDKIQAAKRDGNTAELDTLYADHRSATANNELAESALVQIAASLEKVITTKTDAQKIQKLHQCVSEPHLNLFKLPFSLSILANGDEVKQEKNFCSLASGFGATTAKENNHVLPRADDVRRMFVEFGGDFTRFLNGLDKRVDGDSGKKRSFLGELRGLLRNDEHEVFSVKSMFDFISTGEGRRHIHKLAAGNLVAAGFNSKTLTLDAPSLAFKVDSSLSLLKRAFYIGRPGVYARDPKEYIGQRLQTLTAMSEAFQKELFRKGQPVDIDHALATPLNAMEASSMLLLAIPNDLLTVRHEEVTSFLHKVRQFEDEFQAATPEKPLNPASFEKFKADVLDFHRHAARWVYAREVEGPEVSITQSMDISKEIANVRKGYIRRSSESIGNTINLIGGKVIRKFFVDLVRGVGAYVDSVNNAERVRQMMGHPSCAATKAQLKGQLAEIAKRHPDSLPNVDMLTQFLDGKVKSRTVRLVEPLSPSLIVELKSIGDFLDVAWKREYGAKGKPPQIFELSYQQTEKIPNFESSKLRQFLRVETASNGTTGASAASAGSSSRATPPPTPPRTPPPSPASGPAPGAAPVPPVAQTGVDWVPLLWKKAFNQATSQADRDAARTTLEVRLVEKFHRDCRGVPTIVQVREHERDLQNLEVIASQIDRAVNNIDPNVWEAMRNLTPQLLNLTGIRDLTGVMAEWSTRTPPLQDVSGARNLCWMRSAWGAAVNNLDRDEFATRLSAIISPSGFNVDQAREIYDLISINLADGARSNPVLENKQRQLMIEITQRALNDEYEPNPPPPTDERVELLNQLNNNDNPQVGADFGLVFLKLMRIPALVVQRDATGTRLINCSLPENYSATEYGNPHTWPALHYTGDGNTGHFQFYPKIN